MPVGTDAFVTITSESDCNRVNSKFAVEPKTETSVPVEVVSLIPVMGKVKLRMVVFAGGVSEMEMLRAALPVGTQFVTQRSFTPLQEDSDRTAAITAKTRYFLGFMQTLHDGFGRHLWQRCAAGIPQHHFNPVQSLRRAENCELPKY